MANTVIALKKSSTPTAQPTSLANGELAINFSDGKLFYKHANGTILPFNTTGGNAFGTVNANGTLVVAGSSESVVTLIAGNNISILGDAINDTVTIESTGGGGTFSSPINVSSNLSVTGNTTVTNIIISGGIQPTTNNSYGTAGQVLTSNGTATYWSSPTPASNTQTFTSSGTWTKPTGYATTSRVLVQAWGAGGSGTRNSTATSAGGGGGGGYIEWWFTLSDLGATETVTIGAGGASRTGTNQSGAAGGNSTLGTKLTAYGGGGAGIGGGGGGGQLSAGGSTTTSTPGTPGLPNFVGTGGGIFNYQGSGGGTNSCINYFPQPGMWHGGGGGYGASVGYRNGANTVFGGGGGAGFSTNTGGISRFGGNGGNSGATGTDGSQPGGGGGAGTTTSGAGGAGKIIVTVFAG